MDSKQSPSSDKEVPAPDSISGTGGQEGVSEPSSEHVEPTPSEQAPPKVTTETVSPILEPPSGDDEPIDFSTVEDMNPFDDDQSSTVRPEKIFGRRSSFSSLLEDYVEQREESRSEKTEKPDKGWKEKLTNTTTQTATATSAGPPSGPGNIGVGGHGNNGNNGNRGNNNSGKGGNSGKSKDVRSVYGFLDIDMIGVNPNDFKSGDSEYTVKVYNRLKDIMVENAKKPKWKRIIAYLGFTAPFNLDPTVKLFGGYKKVIFVHTEEEQLRQSLRTRRSTAGRATFKDWPIIKKMMDHVLARNPGVIMPNVAKAVKYAYAHRKESPWFIFAAPSAGKSNIIKQIRTAKGVGNFPAKSTLPGNLVVPVTGDDSDTDEPVGPVFPIGAGRTDHVEKLAASLGIQPKFYTPSQNRSCHPAAAGERNICQAIVLGKLTGISHGVEPGDEADYDFVDIGSNPLVFRNNSTSLSVWSRAPNMNARDLLRKAKWQSQGIVRGMHYCTHKNDECKCAPNHIASMSVHVLYHWSPFDVLKICLQSRAKAHVAVHHRFPDRSGKYHDGESKYSKDIDGNVTFTAGKQNPYRHKSLSWLNAGYWEYTMAGQRHELVWESTPIGDSFITTFRVFNTKTMPIIRKVKKMSDLLGAQVDSLFSAPPAAVASGISLIRVAHDAYFFTFKDGTEEVRLPRTVYLKMVTGEAGKERTSSTFKLAMRRLRAALDAAEEDGQEVAHAKTFIMNFGLYFFSLPVDATSNLIEQHLLEYEDKYATFNGELAFVRTPPLDSWSIAILTLFCLFLSTASLLTGGLLLLALAGHAHMMSIGKWRREGRWFRIMLICFIALILTPSFAVRAPLVRLTPDGVRSMLMNPAAAFSPATFLMFHPMVLFLATCAGLYWYFKGDKDLRAPGRGVHYSV